MTEEGSQESSVEELGLAGEAPTTAFVRRARSRAGAEPDNDHTNSPPDYADRPSIHALLAP